MFLRVFLLFFLLPSSLAAAKFARYLLPTLMMLDIVAALGAVRLLDAATRIRRPVVRRAAMALLVGALAAIPAWSQVASSPFARRQLLLPVNDNYFCRRRVGESSALATAAQLSQGRGLVAAVSPWVSCPFG
ncbi:MAG: hypothetical protein IT518_21505 [Burkholderiales bacterium]|nr:hypothetical protein [Burkholderiales bacterium]